MRQKNLALKIAVLKKDVSFFEISLETGIHHTRLSQISNGWATPREDEKERIAAVLGVPVVEIFPNG
jgi:lambda repressor-like predicted transcriptional regulator